MTLAMWVASSLGATSIGVSAAHTQPLIEPLPVPHVVGGSPPQRSTCKLRPGPARTQLMLIGHYQGGALSTAWVGDAERETTFASFNILQGGPIHLVIIGQGQVVYRFTGATARIRRLTLMNNDAAAAAGIPRRRIELSENCLPGIELYGQRGAAGTDAIHAAFGENAIVAGAYSILDVRVGEGFDIRPLPPPRSVHSDPETFNLHFFWRGGLQRVAWRSLVSNQPVGPYQVFPQEAGVRQLVRSGALIPATQADARAWEERARERGVPNARAVYGFHGVYRVTRPIISPAGLCGSHLLRLYVPARNFIRGNTCHSTLYFGDGSGAGP